LYKDIDGNIYKTVTIETQTWMAENLKVSKYNDGTPIPNVTDSLQWFNLKKGAYCYYKNDNSFNNKYGKLYNAYVVNQSDNANKNVCPSGWNIPTESEWRTLSDFSKSVNSSGWGRTLSEIGTLSWVSPNTNSNNITLFTALPGGPKEPSCYFKWSFSI
jgi:uncharacterized protein (TIGR02145 family)